MKVGLFFGSFNPIHNGHLIIANHLYKIIELDEVWFIPSPQNPFKAVTDLLPYEHRVEMIRAAISTVNHIKVSTIENELPLPSYTIHTMNKLVELYPQHTFCILMGSDNFSGLIHWKEYERLLQNFSIHVYYRSTTAISALPVLKNAFVHQLPLLDISATAVRARIRNGDSIIGEVETSVMQLIHKNRWYK